MLSKIKIAQGLEPHKNPKRAKSLSSKFSSYKHFVKRNSTKVAQIFILYQGKGLVPSIRGQEG